LSEGILVGLGDISPLKGVHSETLAEAKEHIKEIQNAFFNSDFEAELMDCERILTMDGR